MTRRAVPTRPCTAALGNDLEFLFYQNFYDLIFLTSAVLSIILLYAQHATSSATSSADLPAGLAAGDAGEFRFKREDKLATD